MGEQSFEMPSVTRYPQKEQVSAGPFLHMPMARRLLKTARWQERHLIKYGRITRKFSVFRMERCFRCW